MTVGGDQGRRLSLALTVLLIIGSLTEALMTRMSDQHVNALLSFQVNGMPSFDLPSERLDFLRANKQVMNSKHQSSQI